ncbi:CBS domain containing-hemolysin-like protein [Thermocatellispora tengchongensis]|uniref:CBS domain containing-hemolysin-like protein n=1 Tax=Thermocatellispora tengchongensis TaxID=1073253 RepID=A0A840NV95_9ACTN|nr:hemolysin family protein [Thermocatellispora tengchongensis]MBB5130729.1 CBS domain containing-hemolysin-like protein [Thermocatellispora tengchongensis]
MSLMPAILLGVLLLAGNAFFVAAEFAFVSARRHRLEETASGGGRLVRAAARAAARGGRQLSLMLAAAQLGITLCTLGLGMVTEPAIEHALAPVFAAAGVPGSLQLPISLTITLALITFLHMVVGEMAPKSWALTHPETAVLWLALPFRAFTRTVRPLIALLNGSTNALLRLFGVHQRDELATTRTPQQLAMLVGESGRMGLLDRAEHDLLTRALRVQQQPVGRLMLPIAEAAAVPAGAAHATVRRVASSSGHLRLLVNRGRPDDVIGVLHVRDALTQPGADPAALARPIPSIQPGTPIPEAVTVLQDAHAHLGLVTGASGAVVGMVSLTDLLGELLDTSAATTR